MTTTGKVLLVSRCVVYIGSFYSTACCYFVSFRGQSDCLESLSESCSREPLGEVLSAKLFVLLLSGADDSIAIIQD